MPRKGGGAPPLPLQALGPVPTDSSLGLQKDQHHFSHTCDQMLVEGPQQLPDAGRGWAGGFLLPLFSHPFFPPFLPPLPQMFTEGLAGSKRSARRHTQAMTCCDYSHEAMDSMG